MNGEAEIECCHLVVVEILENLRHLACLFEFVMIYTNFNDNFVKRKQKSIFFS